MTVEYVDRQSRGQKATFMNPEFLNIHEISEYLGIKPSTIYAMVEAKKIPHYKIGRLIRFKKSEIDFWMETQKMQCIDPAKEATRILNTARNPRVETARS